MSFLAHLLQALAISLGDVIASQLPQRPPKADLKEDRLVLRHGWGFRILSVALFPLFSFFFTVFIVWEVRCPATLGVPELALFFMIGILPMALGCGLLCESFGFRIAIAHEGLTRHCPWRRRLVIHWDDVVSVSYSYACNWFIIRSQSGRKIRAHESLRGLPWLAKALLMNLPPKICAPALQQLEAQASLTNLR
jgi:hypothetical protein